MGKLNYLALHCTATPEGFPVTREDIIRMHTYPVHLGGRGWKRPGYSDIIYLDGSLVNISSFDQDDNVDNWEITNGIKGLNGQARHIVYVGGLDKQGRKPLDTRTEGQRHTMEIYVKYMVLRHPYIKVMGHNQAPNAKKACPSFDVPEWLRSIGIRDKNIYAPTP